jgi:hypothetical protein
MRPIENTRKRHDASDTISSSRGSKDSIEHSKPDMQNNEVFSSFALITLIVETTRNLIKENDAFKF